MIHYKRIMHKLLCIVVACHAFILVNAAQPGSRSGAATWYYGGELWMFGGSGWDESSKSGKNFSFATHTILKHNMD